MGTGELWRKLEDEAVSQGLQRRGHVLVYV
jgi:hypothetical protein